jgi:hypothetical protein
MSEVANPALGKIEDALERYGLAALIEAGLAALFTAVPFLGAWPFQSIIRGVTNMLASKAFEVLRLVIDLRFIRFVNERNQAAFDREVLKLKVLAYAHGVNSPEFQKQYEEAHDAFASFVRYNGA